ncbi:MAG TPA: response regulator transcription factor [Acidimicrobiales bacterium]|nr:response regulator transcription factor [Acidimicrobiales bacterium]
MTIRVVVADDQALVRTGFKMILDTDSQIEVVGMAGDGEQAIDLATRFKPDVILMDIRMPVLDGISATARINRLNNPAKIVILTTYDLDEYIFDALSSGASGFLLKDVPPEELLAAIKVVAEGDALLSPKVTRRLISEFSQKRLKSGGSERAMPRIGALTPRELEVLTQVAKGSSNSEIASELFVSENTVKTHLTHILDKLVLRDRVQVVIFAYEAGVVLPRIETGGE